MKLNSSSVIFRLKYSSNKTEINQDTLNVVVYSFSYYETRKKNILVNIELYNVNEQIKNHFY